LFAPPSNSLKALIRGRTIVVQEFRDRARMGHGLEQARQMTNDASIFALTESTSNIWLQQIQPGSSPAAS
jgi:hypothetical protein